MEANEIGRLLVLFLFLCGLKVGKGSVFTIAFQSGFLTFTLMLLWLFNRPGLTRGSCPSQKRRVENQKNPACSFMWLLFQCSARCNLWSSLKLPAFLSPYFLCQPPQRPCCLSGVCYNSQSLELLISLFIKALVTCCSSSIIFHDLSIIVWAMKTGKVLHQKSVNISGFMLPYLYSHCVGIFLVTIVCWAGPMNIHIHRNKIMEVDSVLDLS